MNVLFIGNHDIGCACLNYLLAHDDIQVCGVIGLPSDPNERNYYASVQSLAEQVDVPFRAPEDINSQDTVQWISDVRPDLIAVISYRQILGPEILGIPGLGSINLHGAKLPQFRGASPINWALIKGAEETGVSIHYIDEKVDHGPIIGQRTWTIDYQDTAVTLFNRLTHEGADLFQEVISHILSGTAESWPNETEKGSYFYRRTPKDGLIDWTTDSMGVYNFIRALVHPFPGAFTYIEHTKCILWWGLPTPLCPVNACPGELYRFEHSGQWAVACAQGGIVLHEIELDGVGKGEPSEIFTLGDVHPGVICVDA